MKISEIEKQLAEIKESHGDIHVTANVCYCGNKNADNCYEKIKIICPYFEYGGWEARITHK